MKVVAPLDERDCVIRAERIAAFDALDEWPREGDYVRFADGVERRVSFVTPRDWAPEADAVQTSDVGSWYFGRGYCSFSGGLFIGVPHRTLTLTDETKDGSVWFFHHDHRCADNGVHTTIPFRVYECSEDAPH